MDSHQQRIIVVEDEPAHAEAIHRAFRTVGSNAVIQVATTLADYRKQVMADPPEIVLMDMQLPDGRAIEELKAPPEAGPFPILIMTSYGNEHVAVEAIKKGALDYVVKSTEALIDMPRTVARAMREWNLLKERQRMEETLAKNEQQLRQAIKMEAIGRLAGGIAHDFNNMLGVILGYAEIGLEGLDPGSPLYHSLKQIQHAGQRSADLTRQLLAFSQRQLVAPRSVNINEIVAGQQKILARMIGEDIKIFFHPGPDLWEILIDPSQVDQVLTNLAINARDAITGVGTITISTANFRLERDITARDGDVRAGEYVQLLFSDTGCGMDKETQARIFEPFFTTKEQGKGTGLGLATLYGIVKQNKGFINLISEPGQGTMFIIYFPRGVQQEAVDVPVERSTGILTGSETVLLVEDEGQILLLVSNMLERLGYTVLAASSPDEACRLVVEHSGNIDLLLTDVVMPDMNGKDLRDLLEIVKPGIRTLFMSGYTGNVIARSGVLQDGVNFIQKPFEVKDLADKVRQVLDAGSQVYP